MFTRLSVTGSLPPMDLIFTRFMLAGAIMLPIAYKNKHLLVFRSQVTVHGKENSELRTVNWKLISLMIICSGPFYMLFMAYGYKFAPAVHGIITPSLMPLIVAVISYFAFRERFNKTAIMGYVFVLAGLALKLISSSQDIDHGSLLADILFIGGAACWAIYSVINKKLGFDAIPTAAFVCVGSMIMVAPIYAAHQFLHPHELNISDNLFQIFYQGVVTSIISLVTYNKAIKLIGVARASAFGALVPVMAVVLSIVVLNEIPTTTDLIFAALMTIGVLLASGVVRRPLN